MILGNLTYMGAHHAFGILQKYTNVYLSPTIKVYFYLPLKSTCIKKARYLAGFLVSGFFVSVFLTFFSAFGVVSIT